MAQVAGDIGSGAGDVPQAQLVQRAAKIPRITRPQRKRQRTGSGWKVTRLRLRHQLAVDIPAQLFRSGGKIAHQSDVLPLADPKRRPGVKCLVRRIVAATSAVKIVDCTVGFEGHRAFSGVSLGIGVLARVKVIRPNPKLDRLAIRQLKCHRIAQIHRLATVKVQIATIQSRHANRHPIMTARRQRLHQGSPHGAGQWTRLVILV